jgi:hypothetical protein
LAAQPRIVRRKTLVFLSARNACVSFTCFNFNEVGA